MIWLCSISLNLSMQRVFKQATCTFTSWSVFSTCVPVIFGLSSIPDCISSKLYLGLQLKWNSIYLLSEFYPPWKGNGGNHPKVKWISPFFFHTLVTSISSCAPSWGKTWADFIVAKQGISWEALWEELSPVQFTLVYWGVESCGIFQSLIITPSWALPGITRLTTKS